MSLIIYPLPFVDISIGMNQFSLTVGLVLAPESIVLRAIWPFLGTLSISLIVKPLALVDSSVLESDPTSVDAAIFIWLFMVHTEILVRINTIVLIVHATIKTVVLHLRVLVKLVLIHVACAHHSGAIVVIDVLLERSGVSLDLGSLDLLGVVSAIAAVVCTTSHYYFPKINYRK